MPKGVYPRNEANKPKPREYPVVIVEAVRRMYLDDGMTVAEVQAALPKGYKAQRIIERHIPQRRPAVKRNQRGEANSSWRGETPGYAAAHRRMQVVKGKASDHACHDCGGESREWSYLGGCPSELVTPSGLAYSADPDRYVPRCKSCHTANDRTRTTDGRFAPRGVTADAY